MKSFHEQFLDFARKHPKAEEYCYGDACNCACAQFAQTLGQDIYYQYINQYCGMNAHGTMWEKLEDAAFEYPHTWGKLTKRLEALV